MKKNHLKWRWEDISLTIVIDDFRCVQYPVRSLRYISGRSFDASRCFCLAVNDPEWILVPFGWRWGFILIRQYSHVVYVSAVYILAYDTLHLSLGGTHRLRLVWIRIDVLLLELKSFNIWCFCFYLRSDWLLAGNKNPLSHLVVTEVEIRRRSWRYETITSAGCFCGRCRCPTCHQKQVQHFSHYTNTDNKHTSTLITHCRSHTWRTNTIIYDLFNEGQKRDTKIIHRDDDSIIRQISSYDGQ